MSYGAILGMGSTEEGNETYQQKAVREMYTEVERVLQATTRTDIYKNRVLLNAPTGSGKTIISGGLIDTLFYNNPQSTVIWISPQPSLVEQSLDKFTKFYNLTTTFYRGESLHRLGDSEVMGTNWEVLKHKMETTNKVIHGTEHILSLEEMVSAYRNEGGKIFVFIDESHHNKEDSTNEQDKTRKILEILDADVEFFISATPQTIDDRTVEVKISIDDVRKTGYIKQGIVINDFDEGVSYTSSYRKENKITNLTEFYVHESVQKLNYLAKELQTYAEEYGKPTVKPLLLINVPDSNSAENKERIKTVLTYLRKLGYTKTSGKLVNLTNNGEKIDNKVEASYRHELSTLCEDSDVEVVVFKQSIGMGWDCPRASVLTFIRDPKTPTLTTQVIGRILRMPYLEPYESVNYDHLNYGYVYIQNDDNLILQNIVRDITTETESKLVYHKKPGIDSALDHLENMGWQLVRADYDIYKEVQEQLTKADWETIIDLKKKDNKLLTAVGKVDSVRLYEESGSVNVDHKLIGRRSVEDLIMLVQDVLKTHKLLAYEKYIYDTMREIGKKHGIFNDELYEILYGNIHTIVNELERMMSEVMSANSTHEKVRYKYKLPYYEQVEKGKEEYHAPSPNNYTHERIYTGNNLERLFTEKLVKDPKVKWFYKNGDYGMKYFKLPYKHGGDYRLFFPDFLVEYEDKVVIYETKGQLSTVENQNKVASMEEYIQEVGEVVYVDMDGNEVVKPVECYYVASDIRTPDIFYKYIGTSEEYLARASSFTTNKTGWEIIE